MKIRKRLPTDGLSRLVRKKFGEIEEHRPMNVEIPLVDALMSGFALFSLKDPSLLAFDERRAKGENLNNIFGIKKIASAFPNNIFGLPRSSRRRGRRREQFLT